MTRFSYTARMAHEFLVQRLDLKAFAQAGGQLTGPTPLSNYERLLQEATRPAGDRQVTWTAKGEMPVDASGQGQIWLHLQARLVLPLMCQRCLEVADTELAVERSFRFVLTDEQAEAEDELAEEDVLVLSREFNLQVLIEDELLMALPVVPRHEVCPKAVTLSVQDPEFDAAMAEKPKPFSALAGIKLGKTTK